MLALLAADIHLRPESHLSARVSIDLEIAGPGELGLMIIWYPGQEVSRLRGRVDGVSVAVELGAADGTALRRLLVMPPEGGGPIRSLLLEYTVTVPERRAFRFPLVVPTATPAPGDRIVNLTVELPAGLEYNGDSFPRMVRQSRAGEGPVVLRARTAGVPSLAHVVFSGAGIPPAAVGLTWVAWLLLGATAAAGWLFWRRRRPEDTA